MPTVTANGVRLYYEFHGPPDADVLVLSNGILMSTASWAPQVPALSVRHRLLLYDCRGMWQSEHPAGPYEMEQHADDLAALLDALEIPRAHIAGVSYGAEISLIFAFKYADRTQSLIAASAVSEVGPVLRGVVDLWLEAARRRDADLLFHATYPFNFSGRWIAANGPLLDAARSRYQLLDWDAVVNLCESFQRLDITRELNRIRAPALILVGEDDILKPRHYAEIIAAAIPQAEFAVIPRAGHSVMWEQAGLFNGLVLGFLERQRARG